MVKYKLRDYQQAASDAAVDFFRDSKQENAIIVLPTGAGKSLIISDIANRLDANVLVFGPTKEIIEQNLAKMKTYTDDCSAFSASVGQKKISKITFASIGSVVNHVDMFKHFDYIIVDEAHYVNGEGGQYCDFLSQLGKKVLGLTATPFRLYTETKFNVATRKMETINSKLVMLTNDDNRFFSRILYKVQVSDLQEKGFLAKPRYFQMTPYGWSEDKMFKNSSGSDYSQKSVQWMMEQTKHTEYVAQICQRLLYPTNGVKRKGILVFVQFIEDAEELCSMLYGHAQFITGEMTKKNRERIIDDFRSGKTDILINVSCLAVGFDYPELDTIVLARPTLSLALHYQMVGRVLRPFEGKDAWVVDTVGNTRRFGEVGNLRLECAKNTGTDEMFGWVYNYDSRQFGWKALTGVNQK